MRRASAAPRMSNAKGGGSRIWLFLVLFIGLAGLSVGAYLIFKPATSSISSEPEKVSKGQFGVIEIGTKGVRALIVEPFTIKDSYDYTMIKEYEPLNISSGKLQEDGKSFDPKSLQHTKNSVKEFFDDMQAKYNLPPERIAIVRSSGVISGFKDIVSLEENRKLLNRAVRDVTGSDLDAYTPHSEARYTAMFVIPPSAKGDSILLDLGSGNIKGGFFNADNQFLSTDIDSGTTRFATSVEKKMKEEEKLRDVESKEV